MTEDAIFRLASISKPIVTAAAMRMIELGKFALDTPVTDFLPDFKPKAPDGSTPTITIRHLLTHTAGLSYDFLQPPEGPYNTIPVSAGIDGDFTMEDNLARMVKAGLTFPPGAMWLYSVAIDVLGAVMAKAEGTDVEGAVHKYVTGPLQMTDTSFYVTDAEAPRAALFQRRARARAASATTSSSPSSPAAPRSISAHHAPSTATPSRAAAAA